MENSWRKWLAGTALLGAAAVMAGALGAHSLEPKLGPVHLETWKTAVFYQFVHTMALLFVVLFSRQQVLRGMNTAAWCFLAGILMFSGSLYLLACQELIGLTPGLLKIIGPITPLGGLAFIAGWISLAVSALKK